MTKTTYDNPFILITNRFVTLSSRGLYRDAQLYTYGEELWIMAKYISGYVRLKKYGVTSSTAVRWRDANITPVYDELGGMVLHKP